MSDFQEFTDISSDVTDGTAALISSITTSLETSGEDTAQVNLEDETSESEDEYELSDSEVQWRQSMQQLVGLLNFIIIPLVGKMMGRKFANAIWRQVAQRIWK